MSLYDDGFDGELDAKFGQKIASEGVEKKHTALLEHPTYENLMKFVMNSHRRGNLRNCGPVG